MHATHAPTPAPEQLLRIPASSRQPRQPQTGLAADGGGGAQAWLRYGTSPDDDQYSRLEEMDDCRSGALQGIDVQ